MRPTSEGLVHEALFYDSDAALLAFTVPYLRAGLEAGEHTGVFAEPAVLELIGDAVGAPALGLHPQFPADARPARTYSACRDLITRQTAAGATRVLLVGKPNFTGTAAQQARWCRFESVLNHALDDAPLTALCLYDTRREHPDTLRTGLRTHPRIATAAGYGPNPAFTEPADLLKPEPPEPRPATPADVQMDDVRDPSAARRAVTRAVLAGRRPSEAREDFVTALTEILFNAARHGRPPVDVRVWATSASLVGEVTDRGPGIDDRLLGYRPVEPGGLGTAPLGLWLARRLSDDLDYGPTDEGFTVRLRTDLSD